MSNDIGIGMNGKDVKAEFISPEAVAEQRAAEAAAKPRQSPVFEIRVMSRLAGTTEPLHHIKIWADGYIEGLGKIAERCPVIVENRIPYLIDQVMQPLRDYLQDVDAGLDEISRPQPDAQREGDA